MLINIILGVILAVWLGIWIFTFLMLTFNPRIDALWRAGGRKYRYGIIDVLGIISFILIILRYWK